jgi:toxin ParE1/3/4
MGQYVISDEAIQDLDQVSNYFLERNIDAGERFLLAFDAKCRQLVAFPNSGRSYSHIRPNLRGLALNGFILLYEVSRSQDDDVKIEILRVVHGRRNLASLFSDD